MALQSKVTRLGGLAAFIGLSGAAEAAAPALPKQISVTAKNDTTIQYLVPDTDEKPESAPGEADDPEAKDRVSGQRTRMPSRVQVRYVAASGKVTRAALNGLSTAHIPTCGNANQEKIEGVMATVSVDCTNVDAAAVAVAIEHVEHGMGSHVTAHLPGLFHYERSETPEGVETSFTSFIDGSSCSYKGPKQRAAAEKEPCDLNIVFRFDPFER